MIHYGIVSEQQSTPNSWIDVSTLIGAWSKKLGIKKEEAMMVIEYLAKEGKIIYIDPQKKAVRDVSLSLAMYSCPYCTRPARFSGPRRVGETEGKTSEEKNEIAIRDGQGIQLPVLDPYLERIKEKLDEVTYYLAEKQRETWNHAVLFVFDSLMLALQRLIIEKKGIKLLEQLKRDKKLYLDVLTTVAKEEIDPDDLVNFEMLRDLRNRVVHEDYRPTRQETHWSLGILKAFLKKKYPNLL